MGCNTKILANVVVAASATAGKKDNAHHTEIAAGRAGVGKK
jgi:hypothetical protein